MEELSGTRTAQKAHKQADTICLQLAREDKISLEESFTKISSIIFELKNAIFRAQIKFDEDSTDAVESARSRTIYDLKREIEGSVSRRAVM